MQREDTCFKQVQFIASKVLLMLTESHRLADFSTKQMDRHQTPRFYDLRAVIVVPRDFSGASYAKTL